MEPNFVHRQTQSALGHVGVNLLAAAAMSTLPIMEVSRSGAWGRGIQKIFDSCRVAGTPKPRITHGVRLEVMSATASKVVGQVPLPVVRGCSDSRGNPRAEGPARPPITSNHHLKHEHGDMWLEFPFSPAFLAILSGEPGVGNVGRGSEKSSGESSGKIVDLIRQNAHMTIPEVTQILNVTPRAVEKQLRKLREDGLVRRIGPAKGGHWEVVP